MAIRKISVPYKTHFLNNIRGVNQTKGKPFLFVSTSAPILFLKYNKRYYESINNDNNLKEVLERAQNILKQYNFPIYLKSSKDIENHVTKHDVTKHDVTKNRLEEVDHLKLLNILNKIIAEVEKSEILKTSIWENSIFIEFLTFLKIKISIFEFDELFLFLLCFSKIEFLPHVLLIEVLNKITEKGYLKSFYEHDETKFFQLLLVLSTLKNIKQTKHDIVNSKFRIFMQNYIKIVLEEIKKENYKEEYKEEKEGNRDKELIDSEKNNKNAGQLTMNHYMLICTALYNLNIRHFDLFYETSNKILQILEDFDFHKKENVEMDSIDITKQIINIYLSYCSLGFNYMYFYDKLNSFLYNMVSTIPVTDCVTLLLCISTLKEQNSFQFPLCLISNLEKIFLNKFYGLDSKDLLLLIYLYTYLKLYLSNYEHYIHMFDYLFLLRDYDVKNEENKLKLFQIYLSLTGIKEASKKTNNEIEVEYKKASSEITITRCEEERRVNNIIITKLKEKGIFNKIEQTINLYIEENDQAFENEINNNVDELYMLLKDKEFNAIFKIKEIIKNKILLNYYLNHIFLVFSKKNYSTTIEHKLVFHFDTLTFEDLENPLDVYMNMKKRHITSLNIKYVLLKLPLWKRLSKNEKKNMLLKELNSVIS